MSFEYSADGRITKITGNVFSYSFDFHPDSVLIITYDNFMYPIKTGIAKLNAQGLVEWQKDSLLSSYLHSVQVSTYEYDASGFLLKYSRQSSDTIAYNFTYSNGNAVSATAYYYQDHDTAFYSFEYFEGTKNGLLILLPYDADDIMLSGLYGKISTNLLKDFTVTSSVGGFSENYEYTFDDNENSAKRFEIFMGDTAGNTTFTWNCN